MRPSRLLASSLHFALLAFLALPASAGELKGRLLFADGKPVKGAAVSAVPYETPDEAARREARRGARAEALAKATSGADGRFALAVARPDARFAVEVEGAGLVSVALEGVYEGSESEELPDVTLARAEAIAGKVVDGAGQPVPDAEVTLLPGVARGGGNDGERLPRRATTGADGTYRFDGAVREGNSVSAEKEGFAPARVNGLRSGAVARPLVLSPGEPLAGTLLLPDGKSPAKGALVRFEGTATTRWVEANEEGRFTIAHAPPGKGTLVADAGSAGWAELPALTLPRRGPGSEKPLTVLLARPAVLEGRVVDAKTSRPVPRAKLVAGLASGTRLSRSGADGRYRIAPLPAGRVALRVFEPRYVAWEKVLEARRGETKAQDVALTPGATLAGRVVDEGGAPVVDAKGSLERGGQSSLQAMMLRARRGAAAAFRTARDGSFRATRLAPGDGQKLTVTHAEMESATVAGLSLPPGGVKGDVRVVMRRGATITGRVHDADGSPIAGADVSLDREMTMVGGRRGMQAAISFLGGGDRAPATTGPDGRFTLSGVTPGEWVVEVRKRGFARERLTVKVSEERTSPPLDVTLAPGAAIVGIVKSKKGNPLEGYTVVGRAAGAGPGGAGTGPGEPTGPDGAFLIENLKAGQSYDLMAFGGGLMPQMKDGVPAPTQDVEFVVNGHGRITGRAVDERNGRPLTDFTVSAEPDAMGGRVVRMAARAAGRRARGMAPSQAVQDEEGAFALEEVAAGTWSVVVEAKGYQTARVGGVIVEEGATRENVEVRVTPGGALTGRVLDGRSGRGVPEASVSYETASGGAPSFVTIGLDDGSGATTDADGRFAIEGLAPGRTKVTAKHADYAEASETVEVKETGANVDLRLSAGGVLSGTVLSEGRQPLAGAEVTLGEEGSGGFGPRGMFGGQTATADAAGRFRFEHLVAGRYTVTGALREKSSAPASVVLQAGESREDVVLTLSAGTTIRGTVSGLPDAQLANVTVLANGPDGWYASARTGADGRFELAGAPAGAVSLHARTGDFIGGSRTATKQVVVSESQPVLETEIVFEEGYTLSGRVTKSRSPAAGVQVNVSQQGGAHGGSARTDEAGAYRVEGLAPGRTSVVAFGVFGSGGAKQETVELTSDQTLDIELSAARVSGTVVESGSRRPLPDATVEASDPAAEGGGGPVMRRQHRTDSNGRFTVDDLDPKSYTLTVQKPDFLFEKRDVMATEQGTDDLVIELTRGEGIGIDVKDGLYGIPLHGVFARVTDAMKNRAFSGSVALDSQGRGEIPSLKPGVYSVWLDADGYAPVTAGNVSVPRSTLAVVMTPGGTVEVHAGEKTLAAGNARAQFLTAAGLPYALGPWAEEGFVNLGLPIRRFEHFAPGSFVLKTDAETRSFTVQEGQTAIVTLP